MTLVGIVGKVQKDLKIPEERRLDINYILQFMYSHKWGSMLFKRRFSYIIQQWARLVSKKYYLDYLNLLVTSLSSLEDKVLIYEHCKAIHEFLKEIDLTIKTKMQNKNYSDAMSYSATRRGLFQNDANGTNAGNESSQMDEELKTCLEIGEKMNYS